MTPHDPEVAASITILLVAEGEQHTALRQLVTAVLPRAAFVAMNFATIVDGAIPEFDVALVDGDGGHRPALDAVRFLRARGYSGPIVLLLDETTVDPTVKPAAQSLGARCISGSDAEAAPVELGAALTEALAADSAATAEVAQARRIFAAGQAALSLQHSINNPLAALLAEAQLLQLDELKPEQREAVERMIDLCRRLVALVRRLDALASG